MEIFKGFCVHTPILNCICDFVIIFSTLWFCPQICTSQCDFAPDLCVFAAIFMIGQGQNRIGMWIVQGKITTFKKISDVIYLKTKVLVVRIGV
jgi:hypothetical protein